MHMRYIQGLVLPCMELKRLAFLYLVLLFGWFNSINISYFSDTCTMAVPAACTCTGRVMPPPLPGRSHCPDDSLTLTHTLTPFSSYLAHSLHSQTHWQCLSAQGSSSSSGVRACADHPWSGLSFTCLSQTKRHVTRGLLSSRGQSSLQFIRSLQNETSTWQHLCVNHPSTETRVPVSSPDGLSKASSLELHGI